VSFVFPAAFFLSALGAGIIALYLHRNRRRAIEVSTLMFWQRVLEREPHRQFLGKLRHPLSLLVQLLILLAMILALARPEPGLRPRESHTVVVLDARARMQAGGGRVFREAVKAAQDLAAKASSQTPVAVLAVVGAPEIVSGFSGDNRDLREKLAALRPTDAGGGMEETLALGDRLLASQPGEKKLIVITDRPLPGSAAEQILTGRPENNAAILVLAQRPVPASPQSAEVFAKLANFSQEARTLELELALDGRVFELQSFVLAPGDQQDFSLIVPAEMLGSGAGGLTARLTGHDSLTLDDSARALLTTGSPLRVLLLTHDNPFLEGALKADPGIRLEILEPSNWRPELAAGFDAVIFDGKFPEGLSLESGRFFFFGRSPFEAGDETVSVAEPEMTNPMSPLFWNVKATGPVRARLLREPGDGWRTDAPLKGGGAPLVLAVENQNGARHVATAFGVEESAFPLRAGFPLFISNAVRWLAGRGQSNADAWKAGQSYLPAAGEKIARDPREIPAAPADQAPSLTEAPLRLKKQGYYEVAGPERARWIAVNTASAEESDLRQSAHSTPGLLIGAAPGGLLLWQWIALLALLLLLAEWWLHHRRITE
jgi:Ca-activated chloride channel family protein